MTEQEAISCMEADKEYLTDMKNCDGEERDMGRKGLEKKINKKPIIHNK